MPTYEYRCRACGHGFDIVQSFKDESLTICPACGGELRKVFAAPAISFKGSGFYATDSRRNAGTGSESRSDDSRESASRDSKDRDSKDRDSKDRDSKDSTPSKDSKGDGKDTKDASGGRKESKESKERSKGGEGASTPSEKKGESSSTKKEPTT